jgi:hypothetical protein
MEHIRILKFDEENKTHRLLADLSARCHLASANDDTESVSRLEREIDLAAARVWGIVENELESIQESSDAVRRSRRAEVDEPNAE